MDLKKELLEFLEANNNFGISNPEKVVDLYIEVYKEGKSNNYFTNLETCANILCGEFIQDPTTTSSKCICGVYWWEHHPKKRNL